MVPGPGLGGKGKAAGGKKGGGWPTHAAFVEFQDATHAAVWVDTLNGAANWRLGPGQIRALR